MKAVMTMNTIKTTTIADIGTSELPNAIAHHTNPIRGGTTSVAITRVRSEKRIPPPIRPRCGSSATRN
jgi:hypothetical protein